MKTSFSLAVFLAFYGLIVMAQIKDELINEFRATFTECMEENGVTQEEVEDMKKGKIKPEDVPQNFKCTIKCAMDKRGNMNAETGEPVAEVIKSTFSNILSDDEVDKCISIKAEDPCETAFQVASCLRLAFKGKNNDEA